MNLPQTMKGKVVLITGATRGIGKETALALAAMGAEVVIIGRDTVRTTQVVAEIQSQTGSPNVAPIIADLSTLAGTRLAAQAFLNRYNRLHVLVNNAGAIFMKREENVEGIEMTFALNHLSPFLLTHLVMDALRASAPARIVTVSSAAHYMTTMHFDDLQLKRRYNGWTAYGQSKLANIYFTVGLSGMMNGANITANALHPGFVATHFGKNNSVFAPFFALSQLVALTPREGAQTSIYLAASPAVESVSGKYFHKCRQVAPSIAAADANAARRLWDISLEMTGLRESQTQS